MRLAQSSACGTRGLPAQYAVRDVPFMHSPSAITHRLFTVGHSNLDLDVFLAVLAQHGVQNFVMFAAVLRASDSHSSIANCSRPDFVRPASTMNFSAKRWVAARLTRVHIEKTVALIMRRGASLRILQKASSAPSPSPRPTSPPSCARRKIRCNVIDS